MFCIRTFEKSEGIKIAVIVGTSMLMSFLARMMYQGMKYIIQRNVPVLSCKSLESVDGRLLQLVLLRHLYRYAVNMGCLACLSVFCIGTYLIVRGENMQVFKLSLKIFKRVYL